MARYPLRVSGLGSDGLVGKGPLLCGSFHAHLFMYFWGFQGQLYLETG